jgi:hypothetical protein
MFFKSTLTVPKIKDLVNSSEQKYQKIYNSLLPNGIQSTNSNSTSYIQFNGASAGIPNTIYVTANTGGVQLNSGATAWSAASDVRLKNVTGKYDNALADIAQIEPIKFTWKSDTKNTPQVGVLAHTVKEVVPEAVDSQTLVRSEDTTEYLSVRYTELIPLMIASIQELKAEIDSLKQQLASK